MSLILTFTEHTFTKRAFRGLYNLSGMKYIKLHKTIELFLWLPFVVVKLLMYRRFTLNRIEVRGSLLSCVYKVLSK